ncbi:uncharacterized protein K460DRAFT_362794 [Cucurbitaria berberidis CBS 394.84]|uniref:Uncharacterized protein n=1 Tax=Cucurbitaria berberidis CBS 394.84 TaxID=1168544 RepID=A0A9P4GVZ5_9PLEO|nr:uncharacterized protein K460DRAFT_362794 [Cucurbitaria berberidis CBS 394.84]KAF1852026.1 hypothetical protein K460DRAFT_362794 [Cucurbitaria berberidis CBS 394.84]
MPGSSPETHLSRPALPGSDASSSKRPKYDSRYGELDLAELVQELVSYETCLDTDFESTKISACADGVVATKKSLANAHFLYDGDDLQNVPFPQELVSDTHIAWPNRRGRAPASLHLHVESVLAASTFSTAAHVGAICDLLNSLLSPGPLSTGPAGYTYTALSARTPELESFRYDHGIRFKRRVSSRAILHWGLLCDEDAAPTRFKERVVAFFKSTNTKTVCAVRKRKSVFGQAKQWVSKKVGVIRTM